ncbi:MAG TPA: hypothetical protein DCM40_10290, partial [Maribacter sp.]|nr:hypothetical protein [Maribacter sp.]
EIETAYTRIGPQSALKKKISDLRSKLPKEVTLKNDKRRENRKLTKLEKELSGLQKTQYTTEQLQRLDEIYQQQSKDRTAKIDLIKQIVNEGLYGFLPEDNKHFNASMAALGKYNHLQKSTPFANLASPETKAIRDLLITALSEGYISFGWKDATVGHAITRELKMAGAKFALRQAKTNKNQFYTFVHVNTFDFPVEKAFEIRRKFAPESSFDPLNQITHDVLDGRIKTEEAKKQAEIGKKFMKNSTDTRTYLESQILIEESPRQHINGMTLDDLLVRERQLLSVKKTKIDDTIRQQVDEQLQIIKDNKELIRIASRSKDLGAPYVRSGTEGRQYKIYFRDPTTENPVLFINGEEHSEMKIIISEESFNVKSQRKLLVIKGMTLAEDQTNLVTPILSRLTRDAIQRGFDGIAIDRASIFFANRHLESPIQNYLMTTAKNFKSSTDIDVLVTKRNKLPTDLPEGFNDAYFMEGTRVGHELFVLRFNEEMYNSLPALKRRIEIKRFFPRIERKDNQVIRYFESETVVGVGELFTLLDPEVNELTLVTPYAKHTFTIEGERPKIDSVADLLPDEIKGVKRNPLQIVPEPLLSEFTQFMDVNTAREVIFALYNQEIINAYVEQLSKQGLKINYEVSSKGLEELPTTIRRRFSDYTVRDQFRDYRPSGKEIHPSVRQFFEQFAEPDSRIGPTTEHDNPAGRY